MAHHHRKGHRAKREQPAGHYSYLVLKFHHVVHQEEITEYYKVLKIEDANPIQTLNCPCDG